MSHLLITAYRTDYSLQGSSPDHEICIVHSERLLDTPFNEIMLLLKEDADIYACIFKDLRPEDVTYGIRTGGLYDTMTLWYQGEKLATIEDSTRNDLGGRYGNEA